MPSVRVGGVWKQVETIHARVGGAWKEVTDGFVRVGGVWKRFYQNLSLIGGPRGDSFHSNASTVSVGFRFFTDGSVQRRTNGVWTPAGHWITGGTVPADIGDRFEIEVTWVSGDNQIRPALADGVYRDLSLLRTYDASESPGGFYGAVLNFTIREIADNSNQVTGSWTCTTEDGS